jgi:hypothetical protein
LAHIPGNGGVAIWDFPSAQKTHVMHRSVARWWSTYRWKHSWVIASEFRVSDVGAVRSTTCVQITGGRFDIFIFIFIFGIFLVTDQRRNSAMDSKKAGVRGYIGKGGG